MLLLYRIISRLVSFVVVTGILLVCAYFLFCNRIGRLDQMHDAAEVTLAGRVTESIAADTNPTQGVYKLQDPSGETYVVTPNGVPAQGALLLLRGARRTAQGVVVVVERTRICSIDPQLYETFFR